MIKNVSGQKQLISIIVPVYKTERYLDKCITSILNQTYKNMEILLIDDGSPDQSGRICDKYSKSDSRIRVYHLTNSGVSGARNCGLKAAKGRYIFFMDSDDYLEKRCMEILITLLIESKSDCAVCSSKHINAAGMQIRNDRKSPFIINKCDTGKGQIKILPQRKAVDALCYMRQIFPGLDMNVVWGCLFKKETVEKIRFDSRIRIGEDFEFKYHAICNMQQIICTNQKLYNYLIRGDSTMRNGFDREKYQSVLRLKRIAEKQIKLYRKEFLSRTVNIALAVLMMIPETDDYKKCRENIENFIKQNRRSVFFDIKCRWKVRGALVLSVFGFDLTRSVFENMSRGRI